MISLEAAPYYTISAGLLRRSIAGNEVFLQNTRFNIILDLPPREMGELLQFAGQHDAPFLFSIRSGDLSSPEATASLLSICYLLASCSAYAFPNKMLVPLVGQPGIPAASMDLFRSYCVDQGMEAPDLRQLGTSELAAEFAINIPGISLYRPGLVNTGVREWQQVSIVYFDALLPDPAAYAQALEQAKTEIAVCPSPTGMVSAIEYNSEVHNWRNRALLYRDFLGISKSVQEKEYYEVIDWYRREYEQLPLWYKRFGHIIKVIMGKRSFRSLYDDKVKKYRD